MGRRKAYPILMKGLHRLEYRGYDSAGCALISEEKVLNIYRAKGKVSDLQNVAYSKDTSGSLGIAHTRWATHGVPSEVNAHPHCSESGNLALVHNGIIENYATLREQLKERGFHFRSETDTEVLVQLIEYTQNKLGCGLGNAVREALKLAIGAYAIAVIDKRRPDQLVCARKASPLAIGIGQDEDGGKEFFLASDASPIAEYTKDIVYLNDEEVAVLERGKDMKIYRLSGEETVGEVKHVDLDLSMLDHEGYPHFMLKEIFDQADVLRDCMRGRIVESSFSVSHMGHDGPTAGLQIVLSAVAQHRRELLHARRIVIVSCGTSWHAGLIGKQLIEHYCKLPVEVAYASEFRYSDTVIDHDDVVMAISQSGETADTLAAIQKAKAAGALIFGVVNGVGSSIARESHTGIYIHVGPEIGVASTKAFTGQVCVLTMFSLALGMAKGTVSLEEYDSTIRELISIPDKMREVLRQNDKIKEIAAKFFSLDSNAEKAAHSALFLGRGWNFPVAMEGALKLKEISYIHAEGYPAAEMKHGPIALIDENMPVVFIATHHALYEKIISNMQEVISRKGRILAIVTEGDTVIPKIATDVIEVPQTIGYLVPLLSVIPLQLLSYHVAVAKGLNVDQPRNLAKSVTVE